MAENNATVREELQALYARGDLSGVIEMVRAKPQEVATDADASLMAGLAFAGTGAFVDAADHLRRSLRLRPHDAGAKGALARVLLLTGGGAEAEVLMRELASAARVDPTAALHLADTYLQARRPNDAFLLLSAAGRAFDHPLIDVRLAEAAIRTRRAREGVEAARRVAARLGDQPSTFTVIGPAALLEGDAATVGRIVSALARLAPVQAAAICDQWTDMLIAGDHLKAALAASEHAVKIHPTAKRWRQVSDLRLADRDFDGAENAARNALSISPKDAQALTMLARCRLNSGDVASAKSLLLAAVAGDPTSAVAYDYLTQVDPEAMTADMATALEQAMRLGNNNATERAMGLLALARRDETIGEHERAFRRFVEAKSHLAATARASGGGYDPATVDEAVARIRTVNDAPFDAGEHEGGQRLIFIVGMPRSGTSLTEQILSCHSSVFGAGELPTMLDIMRMFTATPTREEAYRMLGAEAQAWRARYLAGLPKEARAARVVTDKHPLNFWSVGTIKALFPEATIVNMRRSPIDVCLSILRLRFFAEYRFANEIDCVAHYFAAYERMMEHWRSIYSGIVDVDYEALVGAPANETRHLLAACGLSWEDACLEPHLAKRTVLTHSAAQVREPISARAIERRRKYGDALRPLEEALEKYGVQAR